MSATALRTLFTLARRAPWLLRLLRPLVVRFAPVFAPAVRQRVESNGRYIFGGPPPRNFTGQVFGYFYDFVRDVAGARHQTLEDVRSHIVAIEGREQYLAVRAERRGAVLVSAHMGSFEVGMAALRDVEEDIHIVFKRDAFDGFETLRQRMRDLLGAKEAAIDDGWPTLIRLRDALRANAVVVMQGDRAMPGQKSEVVPFLHGHLRLPVGPIKLAQAAGSPVVPVFTVCEGPGRFRSHLLPPIEPTDPDALQQLADAIAGFVQRYPAQWLVLHSAFVEDEPRA